MNDALKMQISAFVDGELPENESELLLRRLSQDAALRAQIAEYLHIGRLIRREREIPGMSQLRNRIAAALGEQPVELPEDRQRRPNRFLKPAAGVAIAASVAVIALVGLRQVDMPAAVDLTADSRKMPTEAADGMRASRVDGSAASQMPVAVDRPGDLLTQYYLSHGATSADLGANGILARLVTLELRGGELVEAEPAQRPSGVGPHGESDRPDSQTDRERDDRGRPRP